MHLQKNTQNPKHLFLQHAKQKYQWICDEGVQTKIESLNYAGCDICVSPVYHPSPVQVLHSHD